VRKLTCLSRYVVFIFIAIFCFIKPAYSFPSFDLNYLTEKILAQVVDNKSKTSANLSLASLETDTKPAASFSGLQGKAEKLLVDKNWWLIIISFWSLGFLLAFTPCVLPLILIMLSFLGAEGGTISKKKSFSLALTYVLALALTYAITGVIAALGGIYIQAYLQNPWALTIFSLFFAILALSLLDVYKLQVPQSWRHVLVRRNTLQASRSYFGVALMGVLATLIASPCMAAPLMGVIGYIGQTGDLILSAVTLFIMGLGIGTPLLMATVLGRRLLPEKGEWQENIKKIFGFLLLAVAVWFYDRITPEPLNSVLWGGFAIFIAAYLRFWKNPFKTQSGRYKKILSLLFFIGGLILLIGPYVEKKQLLQVNINKEAPAVYRVQFKDIADLAELQSALKMAVAQHKFVLLSFSAGWCESCRVNDNNIYSDQKVKEVLQDFLLLRVDLTTPSAQVLELMRSYNVLAPPLIIFFDETGKELSLRIFNDIKADDFARILQKIIARTLQ